jgi:ribosome-associated heat shock protein Hsp15
VTAPDDNSAARLDRWLWAVRIFKTRPLATERCRAGDAAVNDRPAKPSRHVQTGETVTVRQGIITRTLRVRGVPASRVGAKLVLEFCEDLTPASELAKAHEHRLQQTAGREKGSGRPTKRDRRQLNQFFG